jgi:phospholipid/cholesterol/gamma-HCH transport system substrate-binding protein
MNNRLKLGFFTAIGFVAIAVLIIATSAFTFKRTYTVYVKLDNISGLSIKSKIKIAGVDIGILKNITLEDSKAKLTLSINKNVTLYKNALAHIASMGIIGTKYIEIFPGDKNFPVLNEGDFVPAHQTLTFEDTVYKINRALSDKKYNDTMKNLADAVYSLKTIMASIENQNEKIVATISNFNHFSANLADILEQNKTDFRDSVASIKELSEKMNILIQRIYDGDGTMSKLINDEQMSKDLKMTISSAKEAITTLNNTVNKTGNLHLGWNYTGTYASKNAKYRNDVGLTITPGNSSRFYYAGVSNAADSEVEDEKKKNALDVLLGFRSKKTEIYSGIIKNTPGIGFGYSFFKPTHVNHKMLKTNFDIYNFVRNNRGPEINASIKFGLTSWFYAGFIIEDIAYKASLTPYINIAINDEKLGSFFGIAPKSP